MTNKTEMIKKLIDGDFIILDFAKDEYPNFREIHVYGAYGSSFKNHTDKLKELFSGSEIYDRIATAQARNGMNYIYLYPEETDEDIENDAENEDYVSMYVKVERFLKANGNL